MIYQGCLRLYVNLFTTVDFLFHEIIFPGNTWRTFRASGIFGCKKKNHDPDGPGWICAISESSEQASESKLEFARPKKNTNVCSNYLVCKQTISNASLKITLK